MSIQDYAAYLAVACIIAGSISLIWNLSVIRRRLDDLYRLIDDIELVEVKTDGK